MPCGIVELILCAWKEPQPFGWQGRHFHYRTVSVWPKPLQQPLPPMYALGTSQEASDFALAHSWPQKNRYRHPLLCGARYALGGPRIRRDRGG
jgi:hypothetical protein